MRTRWLIAGICIGIFSIASLAQESFEAAARAAIQNKLPGLRIEQIQFPAIPKLRSSLQRVRVTEVRFESTLHLWRLRLNCVPAAACVPALAIISSPGRVVMELDTPAPKQFLVRPGDHKQLFAEAPGLRISLPVTCLQPGAAGDRIRVRDANRKVLLASVQPDTSLKLWSAQ